jgi:hypothetical protein
LTYEASLVLAQSEAELREAWAKYPDAMLHITEALGSSAWKEPNAKEAQIEEAYVRLRDTSAIVIYQETVTRLKSRLGVARYVGALAAWCRKLIA